MDPFLPRLVAALWAIVMLAVLGRRLAQPMPIVYIAAGVALGPFGLGLLTDTDAMESLGEYGVILLLFLLGTEIELERLLAAWRVPVVGLVLQIGASVGSAWLAGWFLDWPVGRILLVGFVLSLSSTAVVLRLIEGHGLKGTKLGSDVLAILLAQDLALAPMLVVLGQFGGHGPDLELVATQVAAGLLLLALVFAVQRGAIRLEVPTFLREDAELQVFAALLVALTLALVSAAAGLSAAFGAFVAGVVIASTKETGWVHDSLHPFRVVLVAVFLMAIGTLLDLSFFAENAALVTALAAAALLTNTAINAGLLWWLGASRREAILGGALLSQIGEFSFVLAAIGAEIGLVGTFGYQLALAVIALTLLMSAAWITVITAAVRRAAAAAG